MDVSVAHVIGTIALIGLLISAGLAYSIITSYIEAEVTKQQLNLIAEYVALNLVEILNMVNFANFLNNATMMKTLALPSDFPYLVVLVNETGKGRGYHVITQLLGSEGVFGDAQIPLNSTQSGTTLVTDKGTLNVDKDTIQYSSSVYSGAKFVVWGWRKNASTTLVGIGVYMPGRGA